MVHMIIRKARHRIVTVIVIRLVSHLDALHAALGRGLFEVLGEELALFVEVVAGSLLSLIPGLDWAGLGRTGGKGRQRTTSINTSNGPDHFLISSVASCSLHLAWSSPKYPLNAFWPHGQLLGFEMGANALTDLYFPGLRRNFTCQSLSLSLFVTGAEGRGQGQGRNTKVKAPCPPIL